MGPAWPSVAAVSLAFLVTLGAVSLPSHGASDVATPPLRGGASPGPSVVPSPAMAVSPEYDVNFTEVGLPNGTTWNVTLGGTSDAVVGTVDVGGGGSGVLYDYVNDQVYVAIADADAVAVLNGTNSTLVAYIPVGGGPVGLALDPYDGFVYVTNSLSNSVTVINGTTDRVDTTIPVGKTPEGIAIDPINDTLYVADSGVPGRGTLTIINGTSVASAGTIRVGVEPVGLTYDAWTGFLYVSNFGSSNLTIVNASTNRTIGWIPLPSGSEPETPALDNVSGDLYVPNDGPTGGVYVVDPNDTSQIETISVGPYAGSALFDGLNNDTYVGLNASRQVSIVNTTTDTVTGTFPVPSGTISIAVNNTSSGELYVATSDSDELTVVNGSYSDGGAASAVPRTTLTNTTESGHGAISFLETSGAYSYADTAGPGYLAVTPTGSVDITTANVTIALQLGLPRTLSFQESGLGNGAFWSVDLQTVVSDGVVGEVPLPSSPSAEVFDPASGLTYVALPGDDNLTVLNGTNAVYVSIGVGGGPDGLALNPSDGDLFVANGLSDNLTVLNASTDGFVGTVGVGDDPGALVAAPAEDQVFVVDQVGGGAGEVTVVDGHTLTVLSTLTVGEDPDAIAYDPVNGLVYVANAGSGNLSVVSPASDTVSGTISLGNGSRPAAITVDTATGDLFVAVGGTDGAVDLLAPPSSSILASVRVGSGPDGLCYDPLNGYVYVSNGGSGNLSVLNGTQRDVVGTIPAGVAPGPIVLNVGTSNLSVANVGSSTLEIVNGTDWLGGSENLSAPIAGSDRVSGGAGAINFTVIDGNYTFRVVPASGFDASPTVSDLEVTGGGAVVEVAFTPIPYSLLTFSDQGTLPYGVSWTLVLNGVAHVATSSDLSFEEPAGTYSYLLLGPVGERVSGLAATGSVVLNGTGGSGPTEAFTFVRGATYRIAFHETGLPAPHSWCVSIGVSVCSSGRTLDLAGLSPGTYPYAVESLPGDTITATSGGIDLPLVGSFVVTERSVSVALKFVRPYEVTFTESGLPSGTVWSVRIAGVLRSTNLTNVSFEIPNGTHGYQVGAIPGYTHVGVPRTVKVEGANVSVAIMFSASRP